MSKKKRKRKGEGCLPDIFVPDFNADCARELRSPWIATDISGVFIFDSRIPSTLDNPHHAYGHFQRIVTYNNYMFPYDVSMGLN